MSKRVKCVTVGDSTVGKTSMLDYYFCKNYLASNESTIGAVFRTISKLKDDERMNILQVSMAKRNNCMIARDAAKTARENLGGNGITIDYSPIRHMANIESVFTYEGTHEMHTLILGEDITKISAFDN